MVLRMLCMDTKNSRFLDVNEAKRILLKKAKDESIIPFWDFLVDKYIILPILNKGKQVIHEDELNLCFKLFKMNNNSYMEDMMNYVGNESFLQDRIKIAEGTYLFFSLSSGCSFIPSFVKNIIYSNTSKGQRKCELYRVEVYNIIILTTNHEVKTYIEGFLNRKNKLDSIKQSLFVNSSAYMGSKKRINSFIVESLFPFLNEKKMFLDLMCGSGAVSNAIAQFNSVYSSDAQLFCQLLAKIQGGGYEKKRAEKILEKLYCHYLVNLGKLKNRFVKELKQEDVIFHMNTDDLNSVLLSYQEFISSFDLYSSTYQTKEEVLLEIERRKANHYKKPYCLFTYYFTNIYFGLIQSMQIDSVRYAIDQLESPKDKEWALGVLIVVTSFVATTYAGHFAQPPKLNIDSIEKIIRQRQKSVWLEFSKRFLCIANESSIYPHCVHTILGPWENALVNAKRIGDDKWVVYLDAPYKREEYSRYYHVLETVAEYDYPSAENKGRIRSKAKGERFSTKFFSKSIEKVENEFIKIIKEILSMGATCAWSYSDNGSASIVRVLDNVLNEYDCDIFLFGRPYIHKVQGKTNNTRRTGKRVVEYCIVIERKD